jgi:hypothetical protein
VEALKKSAFNGDGEAAFKLFVHYSLGNADHKQGEPWLRLANRRGSPSARKYLDQWRAGRPAEYAKFLKGKRLPQRAD